MRIACSFLTLLIAFAVACGGGDEDGSAADTTEEAEDEASPTSADTETADSPTAEVTETAEEEATATADEGGGAATGGLFDVGGHRLYILCRGEGSPTVVYLHGMGGQSGAFSQITSGLADRVRVCAYDRPSGEGGRSDPVTEPQTAHSTVAHLHALLALAEVPGPYLLVAASHGGILAEAYAGTYPDEVAGMVMLDASLHSDAVIDRQLPEPERSRIMAEVEADFEGFSMYETLDQAAALVPSIPDVPVTYMASTELPPDPAVAALVRQYQEAFAALFTDGRFIIIDSPHFMERFAPLEVIAEVERMLDLLGVP